MFPRQEVHNYGVIFNHRFRLIECHLKKLIWDIYFLPVLFPAICNWKLRREHYVHMYIDPCNLHGIAIRYCNVTFTVTPRLIRPNLWRRARRCDVCICNAHIYTWCIRDGARAVSISRAPIIFLLRRLPPSPPPPAAEGGPRDDGGCGGRERGSMRGAGPLADEVKVRRRKIH